MKRKTKSSLKRTKILTRKRTHRHLMRKQKRHTDHMKVLFGVDYNPFSFAQATLKQKEDEKRL